MKEHLSKPFSKDDYEKAERMIKEAEQNYIMTLVAENMADAWVQAGYTIYYIENAIAMLNKKYFQYGTKRVYEELELMEHKPKKVCEMIESVLSASSIEQVKTHLSVLVQETARVFKRVEENICVQKNPVTTSVLKGWNAMLSGIGAGVESAEYDVFSRYNPCDLQSTVQACDGMLEEYLKEYEKVNLQVEKYQDIDGFVERYLK